MAAATLLALAAQTSVYATEPPKLPSSLHPGVLAACAPVTLEAAEKCLADALSPDDLAIARDRIPARRFRPPLDCEIESEWRLNDPNSPMAKVMESKIGFNHPDLAAGMIISDFQARAYGGALPFEQMRDQLRAMAQAKPSNECVQLKANTAAQEQKNGH